MFLRWLVLSLLIIWQHGYAEDFAVITLNDAIQPLRINQVKMLYRGQINHLDGIPIKLIDLPDNSNIRKDFYHLLLNKTPNQMNMIWARQSFSGKTAAPYELDNDNVGDILHWLADNPNGVAYLPAPLIPPDVNVLYTLHQ